MDYAKPFNNISLRHLLFKTSECGIEGEVLLWIAN
jgi:hypothetical protein